VILATMQGGKKPHELRLAPEEIVALESADVEKDRAWRKYLTEEQHAPIESEALFSCGAGRNSLHVDPYGNVQVCLMVKNFKHSLRERSLDEIYFEEFPRILGMRREPDSKCGGCSHRATCNNCPGMALWETQSNQGHVDFACRLSEVRAATYGGALADAAAGAGPAPSSGCASGGCSSGGCAKGGSKLLQIGGMGGTA
jgi:radical SAM protein with 4Fe4S-binding SPASM domain